MTNGNGKSFDPVEIAQQWAAWFAGEWVKLSRFAVLLRPVDPLDLMGEDGTILDVLREMTDQGITLKENDPEALQGMLKALPALKPILERVTRAAVAQPRLADNPDPAKGEISIDMIQATDRLIIFGHIFQEGVRAGIFPGQPTGSMDAAPDGDALRAAARELGRTDGES